jgi:hypothetical protein
MKIDPVSVGLAVLGAIVAGAASRRLKPRVVTDIDVRRPREQPDVIAGWECRPFVPGGDDSRHVR